MESRRSVILSKYDPNIKKHVEYPSLVIGERTLDDHKQPVYALVHFRHDDLAAHHALSGVDWVDTIERVLDVPHKSDLGNQSFYWVETDSEKAAKDMNNGISILRKQLAEATEARDKAVAELAETTEGRDKALQELADKGTKKK